MSKLTTDRLKELIKEVLEEKQNKRMVLSEMATFASAKNKIDVEKKTFAVFSSYRTERSGRENRMVDQKVREYLNSSGYPWTVVEGGYKETPRGEDGEPIQGAEKVSGIEKSYLIFEDESRPGVEKSSRLFDVANKACEMADQESFSFGYARSVSDEFEGEKKEMFIAIYPTGAPGPGDANRIKESWAGPWSSYSAFDADEGYYTKVRSTKGTFTEEIENLQEQIEATTSSLMKRKLRHKIKVLRSLGNK